MINPNKVHRERAVITMVSYKTSEGYSSFEVKLENGHKIKGWDLPIKFAVGEKVNIQAQFSITSDAYVVKTVRKIKTVANE